MAPGAERPSFPLNVPLYLPLFCCIISCCSLRAVQPWKERVYLVSQLLCRADRAEVCNGVALEGRPNAADKATRTLRHPESGELVFGPTQAVFAQTLGRWVGNLASR